MPNELDQLNLAQQSTLPPELYAQQQALNRQQQMAAMLMQQNQQPQGQMVSGHYVAPSFFQNIAPVANMLTGAYLQSKGDEKAAKLAEQLRTGRLEGQKAIMEAINSGDTKKALALATQDQYGAGKEMVPALIGSVIPKTPEKVAEYNVAKAEGYKGSFNDFINQMTQFQKAELSLKAQEKATQVNPQEAGLRTSFLGQIQPHVQISQAYRKIESAPETAAGDMSRIFGYMKILDPGSTVREGEYASAENARGVPDSVRAQYNRVMSGQRLTPKQRDEFTQAAGDLVSSQKNQFETQKKYYSDIAKGYRINPENIIYDPYADMTIRTSPPKAPKQAPNANQQLNIPSATGGNGWSIINVAPTNK